MPASARPARRPTLFAQIAVRLAAVTVLFALLNIVLVLADYAGDRQVLADDFIRHHAGRIERAWDEGRGNGVRAPELAPPPGVTAWSFAVVDEMGRVSAQGGDAALRPAAHWTGADSLDSTQRRQTASGVRIIGVRRFGNGGGPHWVVIVAEPADWRVYLPVIGGELVDHVVLPLIPLTALLLLFNALIVRRMLAPLSKAAAEVDRLDLRRMDARLAEPAGAREVAALVAAVNRALDRVQGAMATLKAFTADAAHELRTPLSVMQLRVDALPDSDARRRLRGDVAAMTRLVNQMLDLSQADALSVADPESVALLPLAEEVVAQTAPLAFAAGQDLRLADLGAGSVSGNADALGRVLRNLIENAIVHGASGAPIEVTVGPGPQFAVRDHGAGLGQTDPEVLFRRFWRRRRDRSGGGAGLGLGIARSIVEAYGGAVTAENAPGGGALFTCRFPTLQGEPTADPLGSAVAEPPAVALGAGG